MSQIHPITVEHIALNYFFRFTCKFALFYLVGLLKGAIPVKRIIFRWFPPFFLNI